MSDQLQYGVSQAIWEQILQTCYQYPEVKRVILYGSRAYGNYREGSDIDLAIDAPLMSERQFALLWNAIDDLPIIFPMDVVHLQQLENSTLLQAIQERGIVLSMK